MAEPGDWTPELTISDVKITGYLMNLEHRKGRHKARFLMARGFDPSYIPPLVSALFQHGKPGNLVRETDTAYGRRYVYEGVLETPDGRNPRMRSIWQSSGSDPRRFFVTAYPI